MAAPVPLRSVPIGVLALLAACGPRADECAIRWHAAARDTTVPVSVEQARFADASGAARLLGTRAITLGAPAGLSAWQGRTTLTVGATLTPADPSGGGDVGDTPIAPITLLDARGDPVAFPLTATLADLPLTLYAEGDAPGDATLTATVEGCEPLAVALHEVPVAPIAGRTRAEAPGFGYDDTFATGEPIEVALDPGARPDGLAGNLGGWVVAHRALAEWAADPTLTDVSGGAETLTLDDPDLATAGRVVWDAAVADADVLGSAYDVVLDVDGDGVLSPGDRLDQGFDGAGIRVVGDLGATGPHAVSQEDVSGGDWLGERVYWPDDLADLGPRPLVVISHGNGHDYTWYDYLGEHLASWGYVVMAHQNETQPGIETASTTTLTNTDWLLTHLEAVGDGALVGLVDATRIAWIGHSRGGEGVVRAYARLRDGSYVPAAYTPDDIRVIASIAPTVFNQVDVSDPHDVRYHILAGSSDGDVTGGPEVAETQSFRLYQAATGTRSSTYIYGASHEDFDCCGGDEGQGPDQLERDDVQAIAKAYLLAVVAEGVDDDPYARAVLTHDPQHLPATAFSTTVLSTWRADDDRIIDDYQSDAAPARASSGALVTYDLTDVHEGAEDDADYELTWLGDDPMNGMTQAEGAVDQGQGVVFDWVAPSFYRYDLRDDLRDWSADRFLSLDACQGTRHPITVDLDGPLAFSVTLIDGAGVSVTRATTVGGTIAPPYQRPHDGQGKGWSNAFSSVRLSLVDYTAGGTGLDLSDIRSVELDFAQPGDSAEGRLGLDDVEVVP